MNYRIKSNTYALWTLIVYFVLYISHSKGGLSGSQFTYFFIAFVLSGVAFQVVAISRKLKVQALYWIPFLILMVIQKSERLYFLLFVSFIVQMMTPCDSHKTWDAVKKALWLNACFYAVGVYLQLLVPSMMKQVMSYMLNDAGYAAWQKVTNLGFYPGFAHQTSHTALYLIIGFLFTLYFMPRRGFGKSLLLVFFLIPILLQGKRMHLCLLLLITMIAYVLMANPQKKVKRFLLFVIVLITALFVLVNIMPALINMGGIIGKFAIIISAFLESGIEGLVEVSGRSFLYEKAWELFTQNPIWGSGFGSFEEYLGLFWSNTTDVHNVYLQLLCESGILGLMCFVIALAGGICELFECKKRILSLKTNNSTLINCWKVCFFGELFFVMYCFTGNPLFNSNYLIIYFVCCLYTKVLKKVIEDQAVVNI